MKTIVSNVLYVDLDRSRRGLNDAKQRQSERGLTGSSPTHYTDLKQDKLLPSLCTQEHSIHVHLCSQETQRWIKTA